MYVSFSCLVTGKEALNSFKKMFIIEVDKPLHFLLWLLISLKFS